MLCHQGRSDPGLSLLACVQMHSEAPIDQSRRSVQQARLIIDGEQANSAANGRWREKEQRQLHCGACGIALLQHGSGPWVMTPGAATFGFRRTISEEVHSLLHACRILESWRESRQGLLLIRLACAKQLRCSLLFRPSVWSPLHRSSSG